MIIMDISFQNSIVLITSSDLNNQRFGTGFIIDETEQEVFVLTCAHVINDIGGCNHILVDNITATIIAHGDPNGIDMAVLKIPKKGKDMCKLNMSDDAKIGEIFTTAGFQQFGKRLLLRPLHGQLGELVSLAFRGSSERIKAWDLRITGNYFLQPGYSGSPIIGANEQVIGIVSDRQGNGEKGLAISIKALSSIWRDLPIVCNRQSSKESSSPGRTVHLVTNSEYLNFVQSCRYRRPPHWNPSVPYFLDGQDDTPVTRVSWDDAVAYCDWIGGCLPSKNGELPTENTDIAIMNMPIIGEWRNAGNERQKQVYNPYTSRLINIVDRETTSPNIGFRSDPVRPMPLSKWVFIDSGSCQLGTDVTIFRNLADKYRLPPALCQPILNRLVRLYSLSSFKISATCVTNEEYYEFTEATGNKWPFHWNSKWLDRFKHPFPPRLLSQPVVNVSTEDAQVYCIWSQTRLPNWYEWEYAVSGLDRRPYPWGMNYNAAYCNSIESGRGSLAPVDEYPLADTPEGVKQLCGNVAEWVIGPNRQFEIRGGSYLMPCEIWGLAYTFHQVEFRFRSMDIGFRVVI